MIIISAFTILSFFTTRALNVAGNDDLTIKVRGLQWWWGVEYFGSTPDQRFETANEIHIPVGRNVRLQLEGVDVIHSFWVPSLAGKQDLIPGRPNELIDPRRARRRLSRPMRRILRPAARPHGVLRDRRRAAAIFEEWARAQRQDASAASDAEVAAGQQAFHDQALRGLSHHPRHGS